MTNPEKETYGDLPPIPTTQSIPIDTLYVHFDPPSVGWIDLTLKAKGESFSFPISEAFDPFPPMKRWLEAIASGDYPSISIFPEGWWVHFKVSQAVAHENVRFTVMFEHSRPGEMYTPKTFRYIQNGPAAPLGETIEYMCDVDLPRRTLVWSFYEALLRLWEKPDPESFWREWDYSATYWEPEWDDEPEFQPEYYTMRSERIEAWLGLT